MKTEKEMIAFRHGYKLATNIVSQTLKMAKTTEGCQDEVDVLCSYIGPCPFGDKKCGDVGAEDWLKWMEEEKR